MRKLIGTSTAVATRPDSDQPITNIGALLEALAVGWSEDARTRRILIASDKNWGGQFVRLPQNNHTCPYYDKRTGDIPVDSGYYSMKGFIRFEAESLFPGWFKTSFADDGVWYSAELTKHGYDMATSGIIPFDHETKWLKIAPFFIPPVQSATETLPAPAPALIKESP